VGASFPELDANTGAGAPKLGAGVAVGAGVGVTTVVGTVGCIGAGGVYVVPPLAGEGIPPLFAPFSFSCVLPQAAKPNTAPMATWNNPAPCSVSGCHCTFTPP